MKKVKGKELRSDWIKPTILLVPLNCQEEKHWWNLATKENREMREELEVQI